MRIGCQLILNTLLVLVMISAQAQESSDFWMLKQLLKDSSYRADIVVQSFGNQRNALFWPKDAKDDFYQNIDILIKNKNGLFIVLEGSARIYQVSMAADQLDFTRRDSVNIDRMMRGKFIYSYNDTIHSLGGFDLTSYSADLKYFKQYDWDIKALNKRIPVIFLNNNLSYDQKSQAIFFVTYQWPIDKGIEGIEKQVFQLDLKTNQWKELGIPTYAFLDLISYSPKIATLPWGTFVESRAVPKSSFGFQTALIDYEHNKIFTLKDTSISNTIFDLRYKHKNNEPYKVITYFKDSVLTILTSKYQKREIILKKSDFIDLDLPIYISKPNSIWSAKNILWLGISVALNFSILGFFFWLKHKSRYPYLKGDNFISFNKLEIELIKHFKNTSESRLSVDEVDQILETSKKSRDVQNQKRSAVTRSINSKFIIITGVESNLINTSRLVSDRRMIQYELDVEKLKMIEPLLK